MKLKMMKAMFDCYSHLAKKADHVLERFIPCTQFELNELMID